MSGQGLVSLAVKDGASLIGNNASLGGGALFLNNITSATVNEVEFHLNRAGAFGGGAIFIWVRKVARCGFIQGNTFENVLNLEVIYGLIEQPI